MFDWVLNVRQIHGLSVINFNDEWKRGLRVSASYMDCESLLQTDKKYWISIIKQLLTYLAKPNQIFACVVAVDF